MQWFFACECRSKRCHNLDSGVISTGTGGGCLRERSFGWRLCGKMLVTIRAQAANKMGFPPEVQDTMNVKNLIGLFLILVITGCATSPEQAPAQDGLSVVSEEDYLLDGVFVAPGVDFSAYRYLLVTDLNLDQWRPAGQDLPLKAMNRDDRTFFQREYAQALVHYLVADGAYELALESGENVLQVDARLHQTTLSQQAGEQMGVTDPRAMAVIVLSLELYDSLSGRLLATVTDRQLIGTVANHSTSPLTPVQVRRAFSTWMQYLRDNLDDLRRAG